MEEMRKSDVIHILKILKQHNKKDLVTKIRIHFEEILDDDYVPPKRIRKEMYSESEGSAEEEEFTYTTEDEDGFLSLA